MVKSFNDSNHLAYWTSKSISERHGDYMIDFTMFKCHIFNERNSSWSWSIYTAQKEKNGDPCRSDTYEKHQL